MCCGLWLMLLGLAVSFVFGRQVKGTEEPCLFPQVALGETPWCRVPFTTFPHVRNRDIFIVFHLFQHHPSPASRFGNSPTSVVCSGVKHIPAHSPCDSHEVTRGHMGLLQVFDELHFQNKSLARAVCDH